MTRILIADEHAVVRAGVRCIVESDRNWSVVAEAADGREAIAKAIAVKPDLAILGYSLPLVDGIEATRQIRRWVPNIEVLIFTMHDNEALVRELVKAGARGYVRKSDTEQRLVSAIKSLANHKAYFTDGVLPTAIRAMAAKPGRTKQTLTAREQSVVHLVAEGRSNKQIAASLDIGVKTVETYRLAIRRKLDLASTAAIVRYAVRNNFMQA